MDEMLLREICGNLSWIGLNIAIMTGCMTTIAVKYLLTPIKKRD